MIPLSSDILLSYFNILLVKTYITLLILSFAWISKIIAADYMHP